MLIEIPDPDVIFVIIISFIVGLVGLYGYYKIHSLIKTKTDVLESSQLERLEYYEKQLIDMKIRLDSIEIEGSEGKTEGSNLELKQFLEKLVKNQEVIQNPLEPKKQIPNEEKPNQIVRFDNNTLEDNVLHLITMKSMTSRDIQITLKRSREHISRLMKKLYDNGYVKRNTNKKPYTYSITEKGQDKLKTIKSNPIIA